MRRLACGLAGVVVIILVACVGDEPTAPGSSSGTSGTSADGGLGGITCSAISPCTTGTCVDGFCCESACTGVCEACNVPGQEGRCVGVSGKPRHGACDGDADGACAGSCDGADRAACKYPTVACGAAGSCAGGSATAAGACKAGKCEPGRTQKCTLGCQTTTCVGVKQIAANPGTACAVLTDTKVRCWGSNGKGIAGFPIGTTELKSPTEVFGLTGAIGIAASQNAMCALMDDKTLKCWGGNPFGELGLAADAGDHPVPTTFPGLAGVTFVGGGSGSGFCAIVAGGEMKCWGSNSSGQLGDGNVGGSSPTPVTVCKPDVSPCQPSTGATFVALGDNYACGIFAGDVSCWGNNSLAQLGRTGATSFPMPGRVAGPLAATYLTAGNALTCAVSGGEAKCWGNNIGSGRIGNGQSGGTTPTPSRVCTSQNCTTFLSKVTGVSTFDESVCAVADGAVRCWGSNTGGQLGDGTSTFSQNFAGTTAIAKGVTYVTSGGGANYAIVVDGLDSDVRCWGSEASYQCGDGVMSAERKTPIAPKW